MSPIYGVRYTGCTAAIDAGSCRRSAIANGIRPPRAGSRATTPSVDISAPVTITVAPARPNTCARPHRPAAARSRQAGQRADRHDLHPHIDHGHDGQTGQEREGNRPRRVVDFTARYAQHLEPAEGVDRHQHRARECQRGRRAVEREADCLHEEGPDDHEECERHQLAEREDVVDRGGAPHAEHVDDGEAGRDRRDDRGARQSRRGPGQNHPM